MINKRRGFTRRAMADYNFVREHFDPTFQFRPFKLYVITDDDGKFAITSEKDSDNVFLSKVDLKNKYQWVFVDSDTGAICFFYDLKSYFNIDIVEGTVKVKRSDILENGLFNFDSDGKIQLKSNANYYLGYKELEHFNEETEPVLEAVRKDMLDEYKCVWKYVEVFDLRNLTDNADTIEELKTVNANGDKQIDALQKMIEKNKQLTDIEIEYRDNKIKGYEDNWFIRWFLK